MKPLGESGRCVQRVTESLWDKNIDDNSSRYGLSQFGTSSIRTLRQEVERKLGINLSSPEGVTYLLLTQQQMISTLTEKVRKLTKVVTASNIGGMWNVVCHGIF
jgi:hypothetical protein